MCIIILFSDCCCHIQFFFRVVINCITKCQVIVNMFFRFTKSRKINKIVKMSKRKVQTVSYDDAVADILNWVENPDNEENFELETNRFSDVSYEVTKKEKTSYLRVC